MTTVSKSSPPPIDSPSHSNSSRVPILLLKTRSTPNDGYHDQFSKFTPPKSNSDQQPWRFVPTFVPVLEHQLVKDGIGVVKDLLRDRNIGRDEGCKYGGMIFTSQRAVEAFAEIVEDGQKQDPSYPHLAQTPLYTVGPATSRALSSIPASPPLQIHGSETGNGEALAHYMLSHYPPLFNLPPFTSSPEPREEGKSPPPILFLVGETRRDIIPKTLTSASPPIQVDELVVYGTGVMQSFPSDFSRVLSETEDAEMRWVVVFSPTGCGAMLEALSLLDPATGKARPRIEQKDNGKHEKEGLKRTYIATIGPTTYNYLKTEFGYEADICAEKPSPEGVEEGVRRFMRGL